MFVGRHFVFYCGIHMNSNSKLTGSFWRTVSNINTFKKHSLTYNYLKLLFVHNLFITQHSEALIFFNLLKWVICFYSIKKALWCSLRYQTYYKLLLQPYFLKVSKIRHTSLVGCQKWNLISATFVKHTARILKIKKPFKKIP